MRSTSSSSDSAITYLLPPMSLTTVSGVASARSIRSGLSVNSGPLNRRSKIIGSVQGLRRTLPWVRLRVMYRQRAGLPEAGPLTTDWLVLQADQALQHLVGGGDHPRVGLEAALGDDQVGQLGGQVHV